MTDLIVKFFESFWKIVDSITKGFYEQLHKGHLVRRTILGIATYIQVYALFWCFEYATTSTHDPIAMSAVIAAIITPVSTLFGAAIKFYNEGRKQVNKSEDE